MSKTSTRFGNARRIGMQITRSKSWLADLAALDGELLHWPQLSLAKTDVIFSMEEQGLYVWREVIGFASERDVSDKGFYLKDFSLCEGTSIAIKDANNGDLEALFAQCQSDLTHCFQDTSKPIISWNVRFKMDFVATDRVAMAWQLELRHSQNTSSILAF